MICDHAVAASQELAIFARTHNEEEVAYLEKQSGVRLVVFAEREIAATLSRHIVDAFKTDRREP